MLHFLPCFFLVMLSFSFLLFRAIFHDHWCLIGAIGDAVNCRFGRLEAWLAAVGLVVEIGKQDDERDGVANQSPLHPGRKWAARVERMSGMANGDMELDLNISKRVCNRNLQLIKLSLVKTSLIASSSLEEHKDQIMSQNDNFTTKKCYV